jgi:ABC-type multidrug transport system ATPase subunit
LTPELSACQNVKLIGQLLGLPNDLLDERLPKMVAFSELGQLAYEKASRLSPGSFCRLAMALPLFVDPDICLIDDDIRISDQAFRAKFQRKFNEILAGPATMIFASNNLASLRSYCRRALWLERGQLVADGEISTVIERFVSQQKSDGADLNRPQLMPNIDPKVVSGISSWIRRRLVTSADPKEVRSEVEAYASVARERSKLNRELTEIELITAMTNKPSPPPKTVQSELMRVDRTLAELIAGTSGIQDRHENILKAHAQIRERLVELCADSPPSNMENAGSNDQFHSKNVVAAVRRVTRSRAH